MPRPSSSKTKYLAVEIDHDLWVNFERRRSVLNERPGEPVTHKKDLVEAALRLWLQEPSQELPK
jgi:hypothetical protein